MDWYPWGEEAFEKARLEDKPIFLSIGYSTCYWCHVMEREVFENEAIAEQMNRAFVNIKVDREERPDVDRIYMTALQSMTGSGGWPMSMFLTPDRKPFYGATYIPPVTRYGRSGFPEVLERLYEAWKTRRKDVEDAGEKIRLHLSGMQDRFGGEDVPTAEVLRTAFTSFTELYDDTRAGFGDAPKFPRPVVYNFLLRYADRNDEPAAQTMVLQTLERMHDGGMYDHVGGGFHRYSTDAEWHVPHFEKMLYDQAQLVTAYLDAYLVTHSDVYKDIARDVLAYVTEVLRSPEGGFYSAEDAESIIDPGTGTKKEGAYYVWTRREISDVLSGEEEMVFSRAYDVKDDGNVVHDPQQEFTGLNILRRIASVDVIARELQIPEESVAGHLGRSLEKLRERRSRRIRPHLDDKIIASWNGMMISAFARAAIVLDDAQYLKMAAEASEFIRGNMIGPGGRVMRRYRDGEARFEGGLEDYAWLITAFLDMFEATFDDTYVKRAQDLLTVASGLFDDSNGGGFFDTIGTETSLIARMKESYDGAEPSANAVMAGALLRLSDLTHNDSYREKAAGVLRSFSVLISQAPHAAPQLLVALDHFIGPSRQVVLVGDPALETYTKLLGELRSHFLPRSVIISTGPGMKTENLIADVPFLSALRPVGAAPTVFICTNFACDLPSTTIESVRQTLTGHHR